MKKIYLLCAVLLHVGGVLATTPRMLKVRLTAVEVGDSYYPSWLVADEKTTSDALMKNISGEAPAPLKSVLDSLEGTTIVIKNNVTPEQQNILENWIVAAESSPLLQLWKSVGISAKALLSNHMRQSLLQFTGVSDKKYGDIIRIFSRIPSGDGEAFVSMVSLHNWFVGESKPCIDRSYLMKRTVKDEVYIYPSESTERVMEWWIQLLMYTTKLQQCLAPERLGIPHEVETCVDGTDLPRIAADEPLLITAQTDPNYFGPMCVLLHSIQRTTPKEKGIIISGDRLSDQALRFLGLFNNESTRVHAENIGKDYLAKADALKTAWARTSAFHAFLPQAIMEQQIWKKWGWKKDPSRFVNIDTDVVVLKGLDNLSEIPNVDFAAVDLRYFRNVEGTKINLLTGVPGVCAITFSDDEKRAIGGLLSECVTTFTPPTGRPNGGVYFQSLSRDPAKNSMTEKIAVTLQKKRKKAYGDLFEQVSKHPAIQDSKVREGVVKALEQLEKDRKDKGYIDRSFIRRKYLPTKKTPVNQIVNIIFNWADNGGAKKNDRYNLILLKPWVFMHCQDMKTVTENVINPTEEEYLHWLQLEKGVTSVYLEPWFNMPLNFLYPCIAKDPMARPTVDELQRNYAALLESGKKCVLLHWDNCLKPWNPEYFERCKQDYDAMLTFLYYAECVRQTNEYLKLQQLISAEPIIVPKEWTDFVAKFEPYFSCTPWKVVDAFNNVDMEARLSALRDGKLPQYSPGMMNYHLFLLGIPMATVVGEVECVSDDELLEACTKID